MILIAVLGDLPGWDGDMRKFFEATRDRLQAGELSVTGHRLEIEGLIRTVDTFFALQLTMDSFRRFSGKEQEAARKQAAYANQWVSKQGRLIDDAPKGHGVRSRPEPKPEPVKVAKRGKVAAGVRSLFGDEG